MARRVARKPFYLLEEVCRRWDMSPDDLAPFVLAGQLRLSTAAVDLMVVVGELVEGEDGQTVRSPPRITTVRGPLHLTASDAWRVLRNGSSTVYRFEADERQYIEVHFRGLQFPDHEVLKADLVVCHSEMQRFEAEHVIEVQVPPDAVRAGSRGAPPKYDWDEFWIEALVSTVRDGCPPTLAEFVRRMEAWFASRGQYPDSSTIKKKLAVAWRQIAPLLRNVGS